MEIFIFIIGLVIGSFLNVLIDRLPNNRPILNSRSVCDSCHKRLKWYELFPLFSYVWQRGKCTYCKKPIPSRIFVVELLTGITFAGLYMYLVPFVSLLSFILALIIVSSLIVIFFADYEYGIIPDQMLIILIGAAIIHRLQFGFSALIPYFIVGLVLFIIFLALFIGTKGRGMGFGDVKLAFVIGLLLGYPGGPFAVYFAFLTGAIISLILILVGRKKFRKDTIAFGPFLVLGIVFYYIFGGSVQVLLQSFGL